MKSNLFEQFLRIFIAVCTGLSGITIIWAISPGAPLKSDLPYSNWCYAASLVLGIAFAFRVYGPPIEDSPPSAVAV